MGVTISGDLTWNAHITEVTKKAAKSLFPCSAKKSSCYTERFMPFQRTKKVVSDRLGLVDFAIGLFIFVLNLPDGQVLFFGEIQITEGL